jgi:O-acetyl-ADP-ribose deacetylase (regulator of RNase III)
MTDNIVVIASHSFKYAKFQPLIICANIKEAYTKMRKILDEDEFIYYDTEKCKKLKEVDKCNLILFTYGLEDAKIIKKLCINRIYDESFTIVAYSMPIGENIYKYAIAKFDVNKQGAHFINESEDESNDEKEQVEIINGDLLEQSELQIIIHQCNCKSKGVLGVAKSINDKYLYADINSSEIVKESDLGKCILRESPDDEPTVACLIAQRYPGKSHKNNDSESMRQKWFKNALNNLYDQITDNIEDEIQIGFPYKIGCGLAGGDWSVYKKMIDDFAQLDERMNIKIFKLD